MSARVRLGTAAPFPPHLLRKVAALFESLRARRGRPFFFDGEYLSLVEGAAWMVHAGPGEPNLELVALGDTPEQVIASLAVHVLQRRAARKAAP